MTDSRRLPLTTILTVMASLLGGGAMGAFLTHYWSRQSPAILTYQTSFTTVANTSQPTAAIVPNLHVEIGNKEIKQLYVNSVTFKPSGERYADSADVAITFASTVEVYAPPVVTASSPLRHINCDRVDTGFVCKLSPIKSGSDAEYKVSWATDTFILPKVETASKDVEVQDLLEFSDSFWFRHFSLLLTLQTAVFALILAYLFSFLMPALRKWIAGGRGLSSDDR